MIVLIYRDSGLRTLIRDLLAAELLDYEIMAFENNETAQEFLKDHSPYIILLEAVEKFPWYWGYMDDMTDFISLNDMTKDTPIIILYTEETRIPYNGPIPDFTLGIPWLFEVGVFFDSNGLIDFVKSAITRYLRDRDEYAS